MAPPSLVSVAVCKCLAMGLGAILLGLGMYSHFDSDWVKPAWINQTNPNQTKKTVHYNKLYEICIGQENLKCPDISEELYFIRVISCTFILSFLLTVVLRCNHSSQVVWKHIDMGYHALGALFLLSVAFTCIFSAEKLHKFPFYPGQYGGKTEMDLPYLNIEEKRAAGFLAIVQASLFGGIAILYKQELEAEMAKAVWEKAPY